MQHIHQMLHCRQLLLQCSAAQADLHKEIHEAIIWCMSREHQIFVTFVTVVTLEWSGDASFWPTCLLGRVVYDLTLCAHSLVDFKQWRTLKDSEFCGKTNGGKLVQSGVWSPCDSCHVTYVSVCYPCRGGWDRTWVFRDFHQASTQIFEPSGIRAPRLCSLPSGSVCAVASDVWLVLSRSWPSTHFLPGGHSDSRVKFIWYPWISATWKCQVSGISPLGFDTLVSVMTPLRPYWPLVHLDRHRTHIHTLLY